MTKKEFAVRMDTMLKAVRKEYGFTQEKMAVVLGISKKTLVEIEKGRSSKLTETELFLGPRLIEKKHYLLISLHIPSAATAALDHAHCKLKPPQSPSISKTSPIA